nr:MAG TPA: hypothetical protein [Crassvirales sp.]DAR30983.1 MAG TPA: hypothetical protein [Caudoviricetes sp.]
MYLYLLKNYGLLILHSKKVRLVQLLQLLHSH